MQLRRIIRSDELFDYVGLKKTRIAELIASGKFPKPITLSDNGRAKAWIADEIAAFQARRIAKRDDQPTGQNSGNHKE